MNDMAVTNTLKLISYQLVWQVLTHVKEMLICLEIICLIKSKVAMMINQNDLLQLAKNKKTFMIIVNWKTLA